MVLLFSSPAKEAAALGRGVNRNGGWVSRRRIYRGVVALDATRSGGRHRPAFVPTTAATAVVSAGTNQRATHVMTTATSSATLIFRIVRSAWLGRVSNAVVVVVYWRIGCTSSTAATVILCTSVCISIGVSVRRRPAVNGSSISDIEVRITYVNIGFSSISRGNSKTRM